MSEEVNILSSNSESMEEEIKEDKEIKEVTEKISNTKIEFLVPKVNCPEHIILVVDMSRENGNTSYRLADGSKFSAMYMVKHALGLFLHNKHTIDSRHKFALVVLHQAPLWVRDFTSDPEVIIEDLNMIEEGSDISHCDLSLVFKVIAPHISLPNCSNPSIIAPPYMYRTILIYGRSQCLPQFLSGKDLFTQLIRSPHFVLDVLYLHESPSDNNKCEGIFDLLCDLDEGGRSYVLAVSRNATKLHNYFGSLLAHPFQRPIQKDIHYTLLPKD